MNTIPSPYVIPGLPVQSLEAAFVIDKICEYYGIDKAEILKRGRKQPAVHIRQITIYFLCRFLKMGWSAVGRIFKMNHASIKYSTEHVQEQIDCRFDNMFKKDVPVLSELFYH